MAISFSRPDPSSPAAVADAAFGTARRGFDQQEVRDFLRMVAAELARLQERERFLDRELRAARTIGTAEGGPLMDEETATRLLGEEAARILQAAKEGAASIRARAEEGAARLLREAGDEAQRLREDAELEASRRRTDALADAEAELAMAKQQGREMVEEARAYRERVLGELGRRRDLARQQLEQLVHGRDRLLQAFERARLVAVDVVAELAPLGEPDEYVDLTPTTGPVPIMVPAATLGDRSSIDAEALLGPTAGVPPAPPEEPAGEEPDGAAPAADERDDAPGPAGEAPSADVLAFPARPAADPAGEAGEAGDAPGGDGGGGADPSSAGAVTGDPAPAEPEIDDDDVTATDVDELFARLRADRPPDRADAGDATPVDDHEEADDDAETPFRRRDAALVPLIVASARKLKRVLADEQNEVLDALRRREPVRNLDVLVPWSSEQSERYAGAIAAELLAAAEAGAASVGAGGGVDASPDGPLAVVRDHLADGLVLPLRERLARAVTDGDGDNDVVARRARGVYREWKTQHIDEHLDDVFRLAYCQGALAGLSAGARVVWLVDPDGPPSPDCEDNALGGAVTIGDQFPSGHSTPPMHPGCRCLLIPTDG